MTEAERKKKARRALYVLIGAPVVAFIIYWIVHAVFHAPNMALAILVVGTCAGAIYYVYQSYKLRPKDTP